MSARGKTFNWKGQVDDLAVRRGDTIYLVSVHNFEGEKPSGHIYRMRLVPLEQAHFWVATTSGAYGVVCIGKNSGCIATTEAGFKALGDKHIYLTFASVHKDKPATRERWAKKWQARCKQEAVAA